MNAVIIEDETAAVGSLKAILSQNTMMPVEVVAELESIEESVTYFHNYPQPDIIFMDIHLADGSAFKIFEQVEIAAPVILQRPMTSMPCKPSRSAVSIIC